MTLWLQFELKSCTHFVWELWHLAEDCEWPAMFLILICLQNYVSNQISGIHISDVKCEKFPMHSPHDIPFHSVIAWIYSGTEVPDQCFV